MQKNTILLFLLFSLCTIAQKKQGIIGETNWLSGWTNFKPKTTDYRESSIILSGNIRVNTTLYAKNVYLLTGTVRVINNMTLTIEPGTIIKGDYETIGALMITKGAKIIANGTESNPIIFTSNKPQLDRKPGDWGGLILLGNAPINTFGSIGFFGYDKDPKANVYGGDKEDDSSGILKYVRLEFGGKKDPSGYSSNGLSLAGVGNKTVLESIMISDSADDSFEVYGGNFSLINAVSYRSGDDDYDFTQGAQCSVINSVAIRYPFISDPLRSRCFEIESYEKIGQFDPTKKKTSIKIKNITMLNNDVNVSGLLKEAVYLNKDCFLDVKDCVVTGFKSFIAFDDYFFEKELFKHVKIKNLTVDNCFNVFSDTTFKISFELNEIITTINEWFITPENNIVSTEIGFANMFIENDAKKSPDFRLR
jgi:hypothetical protein